MPEVEDKAWQVTVRLPRDLEPVIREIARQRVVPPAIAVRQLVKERADQLTQAARRQEREQEQL